MAQGEESEEADKTNESFWRKMCCSLTDITAYAEVYN